MSHVWLIKLHTDVAKLKLVEAGRLEVKGRTCLVVDPTRQEVRVKLHWVSLDVSNEDIRKAFAHYGMVKDVSFGRWKVAGFEGAESTTRIVYASYSGREYDALFFFYSRSAWTSSDSPPVPQDWAYPAGLPGPKVF
ncbi:uncharacterized protein ISCGN_020750 [Ixodes scapularis]